MNPAPIVIDPAVFRQDSIDPETAAHVAELEELLSALPKIHEIGAPAVRELRAVGEGALADQPKSDKAFWMEAEALGLKAPLRVGRPDGTPRGIYLHIHGGGWCVGRADGQDQFLEYFMTTYNMAVVSVEYRLAPEHPFPAGPDDCEAAAVWLVENAVKEFGTDAIVIGGESAGAHLAALTLLRMRDNHGYTGFRGANLLYGAFDLSMTPAVRNWGERHLILNTPVTEWFGDQFLPPADFPREKRRDPSISPLYADLRDMPPAIFSCGTLDPLIDDTLFMASRWTSAGNAAELHLYPGGVHAFNAFPTKIAEAANTRMMSFLAERAGEPRAA